MLRFSIRYYCKSVMTSLQLYKFLLRQCEKLPSDACKHYKFAIKQSYKQHKFEPDPQRVKDIIEKSLEDAKWVVNKSMFGEKIEEYELLEHLGKGGFAHVYRARCRRSCRYVAIKMIDKALMASAGMIGRVRQEVSIHSCLKHPNILELYTFFEDAHYVYLVLELAHNGELAKHFKLGTCGLSEKAAADIFRQVLSGVIYLHTHNIIHRDLSLNNLLLTKDLIVKIADFGLATQLNGPDEKHVTMCGTPNYISPEVASRELHGLPADVWGLGCMLYTLLVGSPPFHTKHVKTTLNRVINADYRIPSDLSTPAQDLLQRLLCKDPSQRITLKSIMEHPFLNIYLPTCSIQKQDLSRDSGFLTTLSTPQCHSTQHSGKLRCESKSNSDFLMSKDQNAIYRQQEQERPASFNVLTGIQEPNTTSVHSDGYNNGLYNQETRQLELHRKNSNNLHINHTPSPKLDSHCNNSLLNKDKMNIHLNSKKHYNNFEGQENKENTCKTSSCNVMTLGVPPLCAERLPCISHKTRNAILKIEPSSVIVEFIKKKGKDREEKIIEICKISKDGMKIIIYPVDHKERNKTEHDPSPDEVFTYHNLPQKHWKKYLYASRFVDLVKAKTPKITLYSTLAKCQLMENGTDMEMFFYNGEKITFNMADGLKIIDSKLKTHHSSANPDLKYLIDHYEECSSRIKRIQTALSCLSDECFPLIIGKRPVQCTNNPSSPSQGSVNLNYNCTPLINISSFHRAASSTQAGSSDYKM